MKNKNAPILLGAGAKAPKTIGYVAGRSGGHLVPALTHARRHTAKDPQDRIVFFATNTPLDLSIVNAAAHVHTKIYISLSNIPRRLIAFPSFLFRCGAAFVRSLYILRSTRVTHLVSMGGYISVPICFAARCLGIPITLFELNATPGKATLFLAPVATDIYVCFERSKIAFAQPTIHVPYPLQYQRMPTEQELNEHQQLFGLQPHKKTIVLLGGSQGSLFLNKILGSWLDASPKLWNMLHIVHQTGHTDTQDWYAWYQSRGIAATVFQYTPDLSCWYVCADLIICRAGAGTLFEAAFFKKRSLIIPLITPETSHQLDNAVAMTQQMPDLFCMLEQAAIEKDPTILFSQLQHLLK